MPTLAAALDSGTTETRRLVAGVLVQIGTADAARLLLKAIAAEENPELRRNLEGALEEWKDPHGAEAFAEAERQGYNAVNFLEFTFIPTRETPDHEHARFQETMRFYYPFAPSFPYLVRAWKRQPGPVELAWLGGHQVRFPGLRLSPVPFPMRHYLFLSVSHAIRKYVNRRYDPAELEAGWHGWRAQLRSDLIGLPASAELRPYRGDDLLDPSDPRRRHYLDEMLEAAGMRHRG